MTYTIEDLKAAFFAGTYWKGLYYKTVDDEIDIPDFAKFLSKEFICDICGKPDFGSKNKVYDENRNVQKGVFECTKCIKAKL